MLALPTTLQGQSTTSAGRDFWVMFLYNGGDQTPYQTTLTAVGDSNATIIVSNPHTGWSTTVTLTANQSVQITIPVASSISSQSNSTATRHLGIHVTSTASISLYANNFKFMCNDATLIYPTHTLGSHYMIQDYPGDASHTSISGAEVGFVATLDSTTLTMILPCNLLSNSAVAGDTLTVNLMHGESYQLIATSPGSFSGMKVTSNGKPFATFQGNRVAYIPAGSTGADFLYEQSVPLEHWGTDFIVVPSHGRNADQVRITSSEDNCQMYIDGTMSYTLQKGETREIILSGGAARHYTFTQKVCVGRYLRSSSSGGNPGDPSSVIIAPADQGLQHVRFKVSNSSDISTHYLNIVVHNPHVSGVILDGNNISGQFTQIDNDYSYASIAISPDEHLLSSSLGPVVADLYGLGSFASYAHLLGRSFSDTLPEEPPASTSCPDHTTVGDDFWVTFIPNGHSTTSSFSVIATGLDDATITVTNPRTGWSTTATHTGGTKTYIELPSMAATSIPSAAAANQGFHVTSTSDISLYASNYIVDSWDVCNILPTSRLTSQYIVQDYPNNSDYTGAMALVATEDNTVFTMVLPCPVDGLSMPVGSTYTVTLNAGQTLALKCGANVGFSGMTVTSNNKPFALFQGHSCARVGTDDTQRGRDHIMEQAIPLDWWGREFVVVSEQARTEGDRVRITASENNTSVNIVGPGGNNTFSLNAGQTHEYHLPANSAAYITSTQPVYVCKYLISFDKFNPTSLGDPASVDIPPVHNWLCSTTFPVHNCNSNPSSEQYITNDHHYLDIVTTTAAADSMRLDGVLLPASQFTALSGTPYSYYHGPATLGAHTLENSAGPFYATVSGHARWVAYAFLAGMGLDATEADPAEQSSCPENTTTGCDFWAAFIVNGGEQRPQVVKLCATGDTSCTVTVNNPLSGWCQSATINAGGSTTFTLPNDNTIPENYSTIESKGFHITATAGINLIAQFTLLASSGITSILPTQALDTQYVVLDYPADPYRTSITGATVTILATQANTTIHYTPPCPLNNSSSVVGTPVTHTFSAAGQTLTLMVNQANATLSGMEITSDKPIAVFQGNQITGVPHSTPSGDLMYEQAIPVKQWGTEYVLMPTQGRTVGDRVRVVADSACTVTLSTGSTYTLATRGVQEFDLPANTPCILTATKPVSVGLCMKGSDYGAEAGDASLLMVTPTNRAICHSLFTTITTQRINTWYIAVATTEPTTMTLDGNSISSQFQPIGTTGYYYARISVSSGVHSLDNSSGTFTGWTYGTGNVESYVYSLGHALDATEAETTESVCPEHTTKGRDFWMMFLYNHNINESCPQNRRLYFASDEAATINVYNTGTDHFALTAPEFNAIRSYGNNQLQVATVYDGGYHITSSTDIWLYARNYMQSTLDMALVMPTEALGTRYIVQDYPSADNHGGEVGFVATENNTILTMTVPCGVQGTSITAGTTLTVSLNQGQAYMLLAQEGGSFSGMEVTSNDKPFAMFQGDWNNAVPQTANARDHCYEQALPVDKWGKEFIFGGIPPQSPINRVRITASEDNTIILRDGASSIGPLQSGATWEGSLSYGETWHLTASNPIQVILYMGSCDASNSIGDPSSVTIPPLNRGICDARFNSDATTAIGNSNHYLSIVCHEDYDAGLILDGNPIGSSGTVTTVGNYRYHTVQVPYTSANQGFHRLQNNSGPFVAYAYGYSYTSRESYAFPLGFSIDIDSIEPEPYVPQVHRDTTDFYDTVCMGNPYSGNGFNIGAEQTATAGIVSAWDSTVVDDTVIHYRHLSLTVLPTSHREVTMSIVAGDTLFFADTALTLAGAYSFVFTASNGCDSVVVLIINYEEVGLRASADGVCPDEAVVLTAEGTRTFHWESTPPDPELDTLQGQNPITVHPSTTTTYYLLDAANNIIASITVGTAPPPIPCVESNRDFIDFDHPVITLHDCSENRHTTTWTFSDGLHFTGERVRRQFHRPLPDTITITMTTCNRYNCCADTTIGFSPKIRSVWFPNVFTPDADINNRFSCFTSMEVVSFELFIYNRWGLLVWQTNDVNQGWNGTHDGTPVQQGAYVYRWHLKDIYGDRHNGIGTVTLLR